MGLSKCSAKLSKSLVGNRAGTFVPGGRRPTHYTEVSHVATHPKTKLKLKVDFDGRQHPFHPDAEETAGALKAEAIRFFGFVGDPNTLGLFRADNAMLDDGAPLGNYNLTDDEVLVMRQRNVGGGAR